MSTLLVMGNAAVDLKYRMARLPVAGETVVASDHHQDVGGKGLNQAVAAHRAGARVRFVAAVGADLDAAAIRRFLTQEGIGTDDLVNVSAATDRSIVMFSEGGENMIVTLGEAALSINPEAIGLACAGLGQGDHLLLQGNLRLDTTLAACEHARRRGMQIMANPSPLLFEWTHLLPMLDLLVVNEVEAAQIDVRDVANVVVTRGRTGADLRKDTETRHVDAVAVEAMDSTGAGDVLMGVMAAGRARGMELEAALRWGVAAASMKVGRIGTLSAFPTAFELEELRP